MHISRLKNEIAVYRANGEIFKALWLEALMRSLAKRPYVFD